MSQPDDWGQIPELTAHVKRLRALLEEASDYANHVDGCKVRRVDMVHWEGCTCGYSQWDASRAAVIAEAGGY